MSYRSNEAHMFFTMTDPSLDFSVVRLRGYEGISELFEFQIELISEDPEVSFEDVVGRTCALTLQHPNHEINDGSFEETEDNVRFIHGIVSHFEIGEEGVRTTTYHAVVVPKVWVMHHRHNCRIFQQQNVISVVSTLLDELGLVADEYRFDCGEQYETYIFCVQYRESEINFVSRLLEAEGIFYYFEHSQEKHVLVFSDDSTVLNAISGDESIPVINNQEGKISTPHIQDFRYRESLTPSKVTLRDYSFERPMLTLEGEEEQSEHQDSEMFDYPGWFANKARGDELSRRRLQSVNSFRKMGRGKSGVNRFTPGYSFSLDDEDRDHLNTEYLITRVEHVSAQSSALEEDASNEGSHYNNRFTCILADTPFRPAIKTPIPVVDGSQTATVVGPKGEEIYTDEHGRIKVRFHWDRYSNGDENSSCWVRVSQLWAGGGYGGFFLPRVGQEVIVDFLEGNPDRPIVIGCVYNGMNRPPYPLPAEKTKSTIKTNSSKGGGGFNELRFEDRKGREQIFIHAQRNQDIRVRNSHFESIGNEHHLSVGKNRYEFIKENDNKIVEGDRLVRVSGDINSLYQADLIQQTIGSENYTINGDRVQQVIGAEHLKASQGINIESSRNYGLKAAQSIHVKAGQTINITAGTTLNLKAGGSFISIGPSGVSIKGSKVLINSGGSAQAASPTKPARPQKPDEAEQAIVAVTARAGQNQVALPKPKPIKPSSYGTQALAILRAAQSGTPFCQQCPASNNEQ